MQIHSSQVSLSSQHQFQRSEQQVSAVIENGRLVEEPFTQMNLNARSSVIVEFGQQMVQHIYQPQLAESPSANLIEADGAEAVDIDAMDMETSLLKALVEAMTGKKIEQMNVNNQSSSSVNITQQTGGAATDNPEPVERVEVDLSLISEYELSEVNISASMSTVEGAEITISLNVVMERNYQETTLGVLRREGYVTDPLVINFGSDNVRLSSAVTEFDLDSDGNMDLLPTLVSNSAYIALDKNGDGKINNGTELFGPNTGNGFAELARYDDDGNGFIDSGDRVYSELIAFKPGQEFNYTLQELNVDAIYLAAIDSPFRITDQQNQTLGQVRATSFYVGDNGNAGSVQQVDLRV